MPTSPSTPSGLQQSSIGSEYSLISTNVLAQCAWRPELLARCAKRTPNDSKIGSRTKTCSDCSLPAILFGMVQKVREANVVARCYSQPWVTFALML